VLLSRESLQLDNLYFSLEELRLNERAASLSAPLSPTRGLGVRGGTAAPIKTANGRWVLDRRDCISFRDAHSNLDDAVRAQRNAVHCSDER